MKRNIALAKRYPAYYRHDLLNQRREQLGLTVRQVWQLSGVKENSTRRVFKGTATSKQVYPIAEFMNMKWKAVHDFDIPDNLSPSEFRRVVLNGHSSSGGRKQGRSCGSGSALVH